MPKAHAVLHLLPRGPGGVGMGAGLTLAFCRTVPLPVTMMERGLFLSTEAELTGVESGVGVAVAALGCA